MSGRIIRSKCVKPGKHFTDISKKMSVALSRDVVGGNQSRLNYTKYKNQWSGHHECDNRKSPVVCNHHDCNRQHLKTIEQQCQSTPGEKLSKCLDVASNPRNQRSSFFVVVTCKTQFVNVIKQFHSQRVQAVFRAPAKPQGCFTERH